MIFYFRHAVMRGQDEHHRGVVGQALNSKAQGPKTPDRGADVGRRNTKPPKKAMELR